MGVLPVAAQEGGDGAPPIESDWIGAEPTLYSLGDMLLSISAGALFPTVFFDDAGLTEHHVNIGGGFSVRFNYFLSPHLFVGAEIEPMWAGTLMTNVLFIIPMGVRVGYQFILGHFEFPLSLMVGFAPETYLDRNYGGLFVKPDVAVFWRFSSDWSFGVNAGWWWVPQWTADPKEDRHGNFVDLTLSARFHF
ncbi:hypothetical protein FACS189493_2990 [Spirochaetia bacterium]|nr:hypothetical protein FACS189493_2990 [Spirochaetia bacterium]